MIYTSYFRNPQLRRIPKEKQEAISRGVPSGWNKECCLSLAPRWDMLKLEEGDYYKEYDTILADVDAQEIGLKYDGCVLLCWEKHPEECHRSYVAKWLAEAGFEVEELTGDSLVVGQQILNL